LVVSETVDVLKVISCIDDSEEMLSVGAPAVCEMICDRLDAVSLRDSEIWLKVDTVVVSTITDDDSEK
jgi:hypothetical protein